MNAPKRKQSVDAICRRIKRTAERHGWSLDDRDGYERWNCSTSTRSQYGTFSRSRTYIDEDGDECEEYQTIKIRVSDHSTMYCTEDFSVCTDGGGGDDHDLGAVIAFFETPFEAD